MDREAVRAYAGQAQRLDAETRARETIQVTAEDIKPDVFHKRYDALISRFNSLPLKDKEEPNRSFNIDIAESGPGADDGGRVRLMHVNWGYQRFSAVLKGSRGGKDLLRESVFVDKEHKKTYEIDDVLGLARLEQTMTIVEEELASHVEAEQNADIS